MQTKWIDDLLAVAETKNFSRAAEIRFITQSALSRRIKSLEEWVGVDLVDRGTYPVQLTKAGRVFCEQGRDALAAFMELRSALRSGDRMPGRSVQVVAGHTLSMTFVPKWFAQFQRRSGHFNARVQAANVHEAVIALAEGNCDLMIGYNHPAAPIYLDSERFTGLRIGQDAFLPVSAPDSNGNPLFKLAASGEKQIPYLAYTETSSLGRVAENILRTAQSKPVLKRCHEADMAMHLMRMAREGYGVSWLPESAVEEEIASGNLVIAGGQEWQAQLEIWSFKSNANTNQTMLDLWASLERDRR
ncbi:LysR substrate-binding domain-containing protein [Pseudomonas sp. D1-3]|uniref:LysR substrate-binding domain-containing protein n=1 Tax=Phytopseudomonas argentinensis TaxID=289370 RepID=UPI0008A8E02F|nr:LysR substrate-binding domain-containing protein [Pseudomonas argentinensis]